MIDLVVKGQPLHVLGKKKNGPNRMMREEADSTPPTDATSDGNGALSKGNGSDRPSRLWCSSKTKKTATIRQETHWQQSASAGQA
jgi:hypothetical protein